MTDLTVRPDFPVAIDSHMRATFINCPRKFFYEDLHKLRLKGSDDIHLHAGKAYARGLEVTRFLYYTGACDAREALQHGIVAFVESWGDYQEAPDIKKSFVNMMGAVISYFTTYPLDDDPFKPLMINGTPMVEFSFAIPLEGTKHPQTGEPIIYFGRADMIGEYGTGGPQLVNDDKTTVALGGSWVSQWELRAQFTGYVWAARHHGIPAEGAMVRGTSILKDSYGHAQAGPLYRPQWQLDRWERQLRRDIDRMIDSWQSGEWDYNLDQTCFQYFRPCPFLTMCTNEKPEQWLGDYEHHEWDPLAQEEA